MRPWGGAVARTRRQREPKLDRACPLRKLMLGHLFAAAGALEKARARAPGGPWFSLPASRHRCAKMAYPQEGLSPSQAAMAHLPLDY